MALADPRCGGHRQMFGEIDLDSNIKANILKATIINRTVNNSSIGDKHM